MEPLAWLYARQGWVKPGLERILALLARLGNPQEAYPVALVGGTNGKGTVARALAAILEEAGLRVGLYTSPHLVDFRERVAIQGRPIGQEAVLSLLEEIRPQAESLEATFFEVATALALLHFAREGVEFAVLEVGLGGRFDATNATEPQLSVVTNIGHDHLEILGPTLRDVAREKAGIFRKGVPALTAARGEGLEELRERARTMGTPLWVLGEEFSLLGVEALGEGLAFRLRIRGGGEDLPHAASWPPPGGKPGPGGGIGKAPWGGLGGGGKGPPSGGEPGAAGAPSLARGEGASPGWGPQPGRGLGLAASPSLPRASACRLGPGLQPGEGPPGHGRGP